MKGRHMMTKRIETALRTLGVLALAVITSTFFIGTATHAPFVMA